VLGPGFAPRLRLIDLQRAPVRGGYVELTLSIRSDSSEDQYSTSSTLAGITDDAGEVVLPRVPDRPEWTAWLEVNCANRPRYLDRNVDVVTLRKGRRLDVQLPAGCVVRGR